MTETPSLAQPPSKGETFLRRLSSTLVLWGVLIGALFFAGKTVSDYTVLVLMLLLAGVGLWEFYGIAAKRDLVCFKGWGIVGGLLLMAGTFLHFQGVLGITDSPSRVNDFEVSFLILFVLGLCLRQFFSRSNTAGILAISTTLFGLMYVPWLLNFVQKINFFHFTDPRAQDGGKYYVLYFILVTKFSDTGAYVIGSLIGKHKMIPRISPGKTWEGFGGAIAVATLASFTFYKLSGDKLAGMTSLHAVILGVVLSLSAVVGDLIESTFKREAGVKDSGKSFPGIGGILDLLDSLLFNAPIMYLYLRHVLTHP